MKDIQQDESQPSTEGVSKIKPMLAAKADLNSLKYPVIATPKLDGIRCLVIGGVAMSRKMEPIPNQYVQEKLKDMSGCDGELMLASGGDFNKVQSAVMSVEGEPEFTYRIFDMWGLEEPYYQRLETMSDFIEMFGNEYTDGVDHTEIRSEAELLAYHKSVVDHGYEGTMVRLPHGPYKMGRSTVKEQYLLKHKDFFDDEGTIVDIYEAFTNKNEAKKDELGYTKRSSHKENKVPSGRAGSIGISKNGSVFSVGFGPGFSNVDKRALYEDRDNLIGRVAKYSYQETTPKGIPRFGKFLGLRDERDMS